MKRSAPPRRKTPLRRRRSKPRRSERVRDEAYLRFVRGLPCFLWSEECDGPTEADHMGRRGLGQKSSDTEAVPLCRRHHRERTDCTGYFRGCGAETMRLWCDSAIESTRRTYERWVARGRIAV